MTLTYGYNKSLFEPACWRGIADFGDAVMALPIVHSAALESYLQPE